MVYLPKPLPSLETRRALVRIKHLSGSRNFILLNSFVCVVSSKYVCPSPAVFSGAAGVIWSLHALYQEMHQRAGTMAVVKLHSTLKYILNWSFCVPGWTQEASICNFTSCRIRDINHFRNINFTVFETLKIVSCKSQNTCTCKTSRKKLHGNCNHMCG